MHYLLLCRANLGQDFRLLQTTFVKKSCINMNMLENRSIVSMSGYIHVCSRMFIIGKVCHRKLYLTKQSMHCADLKQEFGSYKEIFYASYLALT